MEYNTKIKDIPQYFHPKAVENPGKTVYITMSLYQ